jgi:hypothetical protein
MGYDDQETTKKGVMNQTESVSLMNTERQITEDPSIEWTNENKEKPSPYAWMVALTLLLVYI